MNASFTTDAARWQAIRRRDARADDRFFYSVRTTGVFCRPSCSARLPRRENVAFHASSEAARRAGFRPCQRCRPDLPPKAEREAAVIAVACRRIESSPELPTLDEAGLKGFNADTWVGLFAPGGTPREVLNRIANETNNALKTPELIKAMPGWGGEAAGGTPEDFAKRYRDDIAFYAKIVKQANIPQVD